MTNDLDIAPSSQAFDMFDIINFEPPVSSASSSSSSSNPSPSTLQLNSVPQNIQLNQQNQHSLPFDLSNFDLSNPSGFALLSSSQSTSDPRLQQHQNQQMFTIPASSQYNPSASHIQHSGQALNAQNVDGHISTMNNLMSPHMLAKLQAHNQLRNLLLQHQQQILQEAQQIQQIVDSPQLLPMTDNQVAAETETFMTPLVSPITTPSLPFSRLSMNPSDNLSPLTSPALQPQNPQRTQNSFNLSLDISRSNSLPDMSHSLPISPIDGLPQQQQQDFSFLPQSAAFSPQLQPDTALPTGRSNQSALSNVSGGIQPVTPALLMGRSSSTGTTLSNKLPTKAPQSTAKATANASRFISPQLKPSKTTGPYTHPSLQSPRSVPTPSLKSPALKPNINTSANRYAASSALNAALPGAAIDQAAIISPALPPILPSQVPQNPEIIQQLTSKSNYQHIVEGDFASLGLHYSSSLSQEFGTRKVSHKDAEQKRRNQMKNGFDELRTAIPGLEKSVTTRKSKNNPHPPEERRNSDDVLRGVSKIMVLKAASDYILFLQEREARLTASLQTAYNELKSTNHNSNFQIPNDLLASQQQLFKKYVAEMLASNGVGNAASIVTDVGTSSVATGSALNGRQTTSSTPNGVALDSQRNDFDMNGDAEDDA